MLAQSLTSVPLTFANSDGLGTFTDKSTLFSNLELRIITDSTRNVYICIVVGKFLVQTHVYSSSTIDGVANVTTLSRLARHPNCVESACDFLSFF